MDKNQKTIQREISNKINSRGAYYPPPQSIFEVKTDVNVFPYQRFWRGNRFDYNPRVWDREAGYSPLITTIATDNDVNMALQGLDTCFQLPCSTILPCRPNDNNYQPNTRSKVYISP